MVTPARYAPISDYALIGDCHGVALVRRNGSIDWACLPRFDSGGVFCKLLDADKGGSFDLAPSEEFTTERRYLPETNVLETTFTTESGSARIIDCFAMRKGGSRRPLRQLLRRVEGIRGRVLFDVNIQPRFDYASLHPWLRAHSKRVFSAVGGDDAIVIGAGCKLEIDADDVALRGQVEVERGDRVRFAVTAANPHELDTRAVSSSTFDARLDSTRSWWKKWARRSRSAGVTDPAVIRSTLVLKLLTCGPTGAIIAAPTTSLPEAIGGDRNWDYRFTWIRDATMTLAALLATGHPEVATGFKTFIETATAGRPDELQIMYGCYGERRLPELEIQGLEGYRGSRPVRVGNGAATQTQLDVYGELLSAAHLWREAGSSTTTDGWKFLHGLVDIASERWREPDHGLWEMRGEPQHFVYSKVMCWVALSRGIELAEAEGHACDLPRWTAARDEIRESVETLGIDTERGCFVQAYGSKELDASLLRLPMLGFVEAKDPRMRATVEAIQSDLSVGPLIRRYRTDRSDDGVGGAEGTFLMAAFWMVDVLAMSGRFDEADALYAELVALANDVGLYSEQYDPESRQQLGNFPQAFTHIAQINAAEQLRRCRKGGAADTPVANRPRRHRAGQTLHHEKAKR